MSFTHGRYTGDRIVILACLWPSNMHGCRQVRSASTWSIETVAIVAWMTIGEVVAARSEGVTSTHFSSSRSYGCSR